MLTVWNVRIHALIWTKPTQYNAHSSHLHRPTHYFQIVLSFRRTSPEQWYMNERVCFRLRGQHLPWLCTESAAPLRWAQKRMILVYRNDKRKDQTNCPMRWIYFRLTASLRLYPKFLVLKIFPLLNYHDLRPLLYTRLRCCCEDIDWECKKILESICLLSFRIQYDEASVILLWRAQYFCVNSLHCLIDCLTEY